jgi:hypothetical protein
MPREVGLQPGQIQSSRILVDKQVRKSVIDRTASPGLSIHATSFEFPAYGPGLDRRAPASYRVWQTRLNLLPASQEIIDMEEHCYDQRTKKLCRMLLSS